MEEEDFSIRTVDSEYIAKCYEEFSDFCLLTECINLHPSLNLIITKQGELTFVVYLGNVNEIVKTKSQWNKAMSWLADKARGISETHLNQTKAVLNSAQTALRATEEKLKEQQVLHEKIFK